MYVAVRSTLPLKADTSRPPVLLIHGSANSARVWTFWQQRLAELGWASYAGDLRGHGASAPMSLARTSMADYVADVQAVAAQLARPPVVVGWSMGAVVAMMVAARGGAAACVALEPSPLSRAFNPKAELREGEFGGEEYGITSLDPANQPAMPDLDREERLIAVSSLCNESRYARDERRRAGIVIESMSCPLLIVNGPVRRREDPDRWKDLWLPADYLEPDEGSHWGTVLNRRLLKTLVPQVCVWLDRCIPKIQPDRGGPVPQVAENPTARPPVPFEPGILVENAAQLQRLHSLVERLGGNDIPLEDGWSAGVALAHLAFWDRRALRLLAHWRDHKVAADDHPDDAIINDSLLDEWKLLSLAQAAELAINAAKAIDQMAEGMDPGTVSATIVGGDDWLLRRGRHRREHLDQIERGLQAR